MRSDFSKGFKSKLFTVLSTSFRDINRTDAVIMIFPSYMVDRIQNLKQGYPHLYSLALKFQRIRNLLTLHNLELQLSPLVDHQLNHIYYLLDRSLKYKVIHKIQIQSTLVISNNRLSQRENLILVLTQKSNIR